MKVGVVICHRFAYFYFYFIILSGFDPALGLGFYFFSLKGTKKGERNCVGNNEMNEIIDLIKSLQTDFLQTFITTKLICLWN